MLKKEINTYHGNRILFSIIFLICAFSFYIWYSSLPSSETIEDNSNANQPRIIIVETTPKYTPSPSPTISQKLPKPSTKSVVTNSPVPFQDPCHDYKQSDGLAYLEVTFQYPNTQDAETTITLTPTGKCPAILPTGETIKVTKTIPVGTTSWRSPGFGPGQLRVDVNYKGQGQGSDVVFYSGNHKLVVDLRNP